MFNYKPKHRFYIPPENVSDDIIIITQPEYHHIVDVIRYKEGYNICLFDGKGNEYIGDIMSIDRIAKNIKVKINNIHKNKILDRPFILMQSLIKGAKMDFIVEKAAEMGVTHIFPVRTERSVIRLDTKKEGLKIDKWKRIVKEASKQCGRNQLPVLDKIWNLDEALAALDWIDTKIICTIHDRAINLKKISSQRPAPFGRGIFDDGGKKTGSIVIAIGPEGGFSEKEIEQAQNKGWVPVRLGSIKMRAETAAVVMLGILGYEYDYFLY